MTQCTRDRGIAIVEAAISDLRRLVAPTEWLEKNIARNERVIALLRQCPEEPTEGDAK